MTELFFSKKWSDSERSELFSMFDLVMPFFPELGVLPKITVNKLPENSPFLGVAHAESLDLKWRPTFHTIGHELMHLVRKNRLSDLPYSEFATDVFTTARADLFNDAPCNYVIYSREIFEANPVLHRELMVLGVEYYKKYGKYAWCKVLKQKLKVESMRLRLPKEENVLVIQE